VRTGEEGHDPWRHKHGEWQADIPSKVRFKPVRFATPSSDLHRCGMSRMRWKDSACVHRQHLRDKEFERLDFGARPWQTKHNTHHCGCGLRAQRDS
jgi:hypothetical protein